MLSRSKHSKESSSKANNDVLSTTRKPFKSDIKAPHAITVNEVLGNKPKTEEIKMTGAAAQSPLEALKKKAVKAPEPKKETHKKVSVKPVKVVPKTEEAAPQKNETASSLLEKCMPYITEGGGKLEEEKPAYTLDSIEDIIHNSDNKAKALLDKLNGMGTVVYDDLSAKRNLNKQEPKPEEPKEEKPVEPQRHADTEKYETQVIEMSPSPAYKISDIDNSDTATQKTAMFVPVSYDDDDNYEDISSGTNILDLKDKIFETDKSTDKKIVTDEAFAPEQFKVEDDYLSFSDAKRIGKSLLKNSRAAGLRLIGTALLTIMLLIAKIPSIYDALYSNKSFFATMAAAVLLILGLINYDIFTAIKSLITKRPKPEATIGITTVLSLIFTISCMSDGKNPYNWVIFSAVTLLFKCIAVSMRNTYILNNFRIIATKRPKKAIKFVDDRQITFAMAKNSIEGEALVGMSVKCETVQEFLKHTYKDSVMNGVLGKFATIILIIGVLISAGIGIYNSSIFTALQAICIITGFAFAPTIMFTDIFPLMRASVSLNKKGAMIAGTSAAKDIELANATAVQVTDLFPAGTVTLSSIQSLGENNINQTLLDATAILKQINSPLFDIFDRIVKTGKKDLPTADTIKYEDALGVSGWVGNRHIFIGNRTLLTAHGIKTPSYNVDKQILASNNFPIYIASGETPCALLAVQYHVDTDIADELIKLSNSGVMILVDSCDQNVTSQMVCDYFGLPDDSVYIMGSSGSELYKNATRDEDGVSSGAAYRDNCESIFAIFNQASKIKRTVTSLTVYHIIATVVLTGVFVYNMFFGNTTPLESGIMPIYTTVSLLISYIISLFNK